jgi:hypothetical protein
LRQRLTNAALEANLEAIVPDGVKRVDSRIFLAMRLRFSIENVGRVAAYKWSVNVREISGEIAGRENDYIFDQRKFPEGVGHRGGIRLDDTILPGGFMEENIPFGLLINPMNESQEGIQFDLEKLLDAVRLSYRIATETSPGDLKHVGLGTAIKLRELSEFVVSRL